MIRHTLLSAATTLLLVLTACRGPHGPEAVVETFYQSVAAGETATAMDLWTAEAQDEGGLMIAMLMDLFREEIEERGGFKYLTFQLDEDSEGIDFPVRATAVYSDGHEESVVWVVREENGWRIHDFVDS